MSVLARHIAPVILLAALGGSVIWGRLPPMIQISGEIETKQVKPGSRIVVRREVHWIRSDCVDIAINVDLVDSLGFNHALARMDLGVPHRQPHTQREWPVPYSMPWGMSRYRSWFTVECFPFYERWPIVIALPDLTFEVVP